jgi:hypothetical protein
VFVLWCIICALAAAVIEVMVGTGGWYLPCFALVSFYFLVICDVHRVVWILAATGLLIDLLLNRCAPASVLLLGPLCALAGLWRQHGDCVVAPAQLVPGLLVGAVTGFVFLVAVRIPSYGLGASGTVRAMGFMVVLTLVGGLLLPIVCALLDSLARGLNLDQYRQAQDDHGRTT